jgi:hypothetical protein
MKMYPIAGEVFAVGRWPFMGNSFRSVTFVSYTFLYGTYAQVLTATKDES